MTTLPHRRTSRLPDYDYGNPGWYFVTVCTYARRHLFGQVVNGQARLNDLGNIVKFEWTSGTRLRTARVDQIVVMPNHVHAIVVMGERTGAYTPFDSNRCDATHAPLPGMGITLGRVVARLKAIVTNRARQEIGLGCPIWQRNYYESVIRNERELAAVRQYVVNNPTTWANDPYR